MQTQIPRETKEILDATPMRLIEEYMDERKGRTILSQTNPVFTKGCI